MELWVRNQDRKCLTKVYDIWIDDTDMVDKSYVSIMANSNFSFELGKYKTKERALEVLDEIQKILKPQEYYIETERGTFTKTSDISTYVYEMPKE